MEAGSPPRLAVEWLAVGTPANGSFRSFVDFLESEYDTGEQSEAAVLEQQAGGVQLMTVHKAKGLEFPIVILADMTSSATRRGGCDRHVNSEARLCAQKLCSWAPCRKELAWHDCSGWPPYIIRLLIPP
jgi:ATP-dependent exoDNAse (exonuclease V) beta subunit